jgi:hypothetical protein
MGGKPLDACQNWATQWGPSSNIPLQNGNANYGRHKNLRRHEVVVISQGASRDGAKSVCYFTQFTREHAAIMHARACRAWYGPRAHRVVKKKDRGTSAR